MSSDHLPCPECLCHKASKWQFEKNMLHEQIKSLQHEIRALRQYGNKDCTAMADEALENEFDRSFEV